MPTPNQPLFRSNAVKHYMQGREKHTFPRFVSLPITIFLWILLSLFIAAGMLVWSEEIPMYVTTQGIVIVHAATQPATSKSQPATSKSQPATSKSQPATSKPQPATAMAVFFFPPAQAGNLHPGMPIRLHIGPSGSLLNSQIASIQPGVMSPATIRTLFQSKNSVLPITQPSTVVIVKLDPALATAYEGSTVIADVQVGSQRLISLLPGIGSLFGE